MAGYFNHSMSNNALAAYSGGLRPISKWTKKDLINQVLGYENCVFSRADLESCSLQALKHYLLQYEEWHHTSKHFNRTSFYGINLENAADRTILEAMKSFKPGADTKPASYKGEIKFEEWIGTRNNGRFHTRAALAIVKNNWAYTLKGKKLVTGNHVLGIERYKRAPKGTSTEFAAIAKKYDL